MDILQYMLYSLIALIIGFILDIIFGDPNYFFHPVRLIGNLIVKLELILRKIFPRTPRGEIVAGVLLVIFVVCISVLIPGLILILAYNFSVYFGIVIESIFAYQLLSMKALKKESMKIYSKLKNNDIESARNAVAMIVGRDTDKLSGEGITKATVETVAENTSDGIIAPLFYMAIGGVLFGFLYKSVNTMDSMVGYKNEKYLYFGRVAAKLDDVLNFIPARLSAFIMLIGVLLGRYNLKNALKIYSRDRYNHASPNSAHTEAVVAGALNIQLAGDAYYFGKLYKKETIGDSIRPLEYQDIKKTNDILYITGALGLFFLVIIKYILLNILL